MQAGFRLFVTYLSERAGPSATTSWRGTTAIEQYAHPLEDTEFWDAQRQGLAEPHVEPVNRFIDGLAKRKGQAMPHVAPKHGGVEARVLSILRIPDP